MQIWGQAAQNKQSMIFCSSQEAEMPSKTEVIFSKIKKNTHQKHDSYECVLETEPATL